MRRIKKAKIQFISLVPRGANRLPVIFKSDQGKDTFDFDLIFKASTDFLEKGELYACVYAPELRDSQGDIASASVIKDMMHDAAKNGLNVDVRHNEQALKKDDAFIAESFEIQKGDERFAGMKTYDGKAVDVTGGWGVVIKIDSEDLRKQYREGKWNGVSMSGPAVMELEKEDQAQLVLEGLLKRLNLSSDNGDLDMTPTELETAVAKGNDNLATKIVTGVAAAFTAALTSAGLIKKEAATETEAEKTARLAKDEKEKADASKSPPVFKGDSMKIEDVKAHQTALKKWHLQKDVDWSNADSVAKYETALAALAATGTAEADAKKSAREIELEKSLASQQSELDGIRKTSNQPTGEGTQPASNDQGGKKFVGGQFEGLKKEDADAAKLGSAMAAWSNSRRGYSNG